MEDVDGPIVQELDGGALSRGADGFAVDADGTRYLPPAYSGP